MLADRGILYAPDYVINAGGIINVLRHIDAADRRLKSTAGSTRFPAVFPKSGKKVMPAVRPLRKLPTKWRKSLSAVDVNPLA